MQFFIPFLPVYLLGNLHCMGMCGPLVTLLAKHPARWGYFLGRILSFSFAGALAGSLGSVLSYFLAAYHLPATTSLLFGIFILLFAISESKPGFFARLSFLATRNFSSILLRPLAISPFIVGLLTVFLPCGQSLFVFSASALSEDLWLGLANAFLFSLLTSPGLAASFFVPKSLNMKSGRQKKVVVILMSLVGLQSILRGAADLGLVPHCTLLSFSSCHITLF